MKSKSFVFLDNKTPSTHLSFLDSLRGLSALMVIASHYVLSYGLFCTEERCDFLMSDTPLHIWWDGYAAVSFFFVLSGFVLSLKVLENAQTCQALCAYWRQKYLSYAVMRTCRICIPYMVVMGMSLWLKHEMPVYQSAAEPSDWFLRFWTEPLTGWDYLKELDLSGWHELTLLPQAWTLSVEWVISLFLPLAMILLGWQAALIAVCVVLILWIENSAVFVFHFILGMALAKWKALIKDKISAHSSMKYIGFAVALFCYTFRFSVPVYLSQYWHYEMPENSIWALTALGAALLLAVVLSSQRLQRYLQHPYLVGLGKISYSVYLVHFAILLRVTPWIFSLLNPLATHGVILWWCGFGATIGMSILLAIPCFAVVEQRAIAIGRWMGNRISAWLNS